MERNVGLGQVIYSRFFCLWPGLYVRVIYSQRHEFNKKLCVMEKHVSGSRKRRPAAGGKTHSLSVGILWLLPSTTRCTGREAGRGN